MKRRSGQTAVMMALSLTMIFGLFGFTVDLGASYYQKQKAQGAAESAALAAASYAKTNGVSCGTNGITCNSTLTSCSSITSTSSPVLYVGCQYANQNGFPMSSISMAANLTSTAAPPCGNCGSPTYWIQSQVSTTNNNLFLGAANIANPNINAAAVAGVTATAGGAASGGGCVYVLNATTANAWVQSGGTFTTGCGVYVNSNNNKAFVMSGGIDTFNGGSSLDIVGKEDKVGGILTFNGGGSVKQNQASFSNPVSGLTAPTPATPCKADPNISGGNSNPIAAGTYCSLTISGGNGIVFSGTYIITSGNFSLSGGNFTTAASGATIYVPSTNTTGGIEISGGNGTFTAPSSGNLAGFALWQNNSLSANVSGGNFTVNGIIYMPNAALAYSGSNTAATMSIVVNTLTMSGANISQPAESSFFSNGSTGGSPTISSGYLVQ